MATKTVDSSLPLNGMALEVHGPTCCDWLTRVFWRALQGGGAGLAVGLAAGSLLAFGAIEILAVAALGALTLAAYEALQIYQEEQVVPTRLALLDQLPESEVIGRIRTVASHAQIHFAAARGCHALHHDITVLTDTVDDAHKQPLRSFMDALQGTRVFYPDGTQLTLDFSIQRARLEGQKIRFTVEKLNPKAANIDEDVRRVWRLEHEIFGHQEARPLVWIDQVVKSGCCYAARSGQQIIGYLLYRTDEEPHLHVCGMGRKAGAARAGVGEALFQAFLAERGKMPAALEVREGNEPAKALYRKMGFVETGREEPYYHFPDEAACQMRLA